MAGFAGKGAAPPRALCIAGPTASGKTAAAMAIAGEMPVEIVSVDSALVYRGMDIGTAKPSAAERAQVPHHLVDVLDPAQAYSAAQFASDARALIEAICARGRVPLLVGGTMLYFKALLEGIDPMPAADAALRAEIDAQAMREGWPALHAELANVDPATAARLPPTDSQRIQRALEVYRASGKPLSAWHASGRSSAAAQTCADEPAMDHSPGPPAIMAARGDLPSTHAGDAARADVPFPHVNDPAPTDPPFERRHAGARIDLPIISLEPDDRGWLHQRIATRFEAMMAAGFVDEVRALRSRGDLHPGLPSMRCVGYRQAWEALDEGSPQALGALPGHAVAATRQLAKRQLTWLRGMPARHVIPADAPDVTARVVEQALELLRRKHAVPR